jgi:tetratricopeptide (TPR) repeat protein
MGITIEFRDEQFLLGFSDSVVQMMPDQETWNLLSLCELRLRYNPRDPDALFAKAAVLARLGKYCQALGYLDRLTDEDEEYPGARRFRARILMEMSRPSGSLVWLGKGKEAR